MHVTYSVPFMILPVALLRYRPVHEKQKFRRCLFESLYCRRSVLHTYWYVLLRNSYARTVFQVRYYPYVRTVPVYVVYERAFWVSFFYFYDLSGDWTHIQTNWIFIIWRLDGYFGILSLEIERKMNYSHPSIQMLFHFSI